MIQQLRWFQTLAFMAGLCCLALVISEGSLTAEQSASAAPQEEVSTDLQNEDPGAEAAQEEDTEAKEQEKAPPKKKPKVNVAALKVQGTLAEGQGPMSAFGVDDANLMGMIKRLDKAGDDDKVTSVLLRLRNPSVGRGKLHELRTAIARTRKAGKKVYASLEMATPADYLIAAACDKIMMPESGTLVLPGIRAEMMFYKNLFEKLDIEPDMIQVGDFKGAAEPYMREKMSTNLRAQMSTVMADLYAQMVQTIAQDRGLEETRVEELIDRGLMTAEEALDAGLIDLIGYEQDWRQELVAGCPEENLNLIENYGKKEVDTDFSGMSGFIKLMEMFSGNKPSSKKSKQDKIALVYAVGAITTGKSTSSLFGGEVMGSETMVAALEEADEDAAVAAIVLRVDSPGGSALASDLIWNAIQKIEKPVVCSMGDVAGSGGYYISMGCDKIYAEPGTITGSIGVVGGKLATGKMFEKFGLTTDVISYGKNSGIFSTRDRFNKTERKAMQRLMAETYSQFTEKAADGRGMELDKLKSLASGRIWTGRQAKENGLVDEVGTLRDALREAQKLAGLDDSETPPLLILPEQKSFFEQLLEGNSAQTPAVQTPAVQALPPAIQQHLAELEVLQRLSSEPTLLLLPCRIGF